MEKNVIKQIILRWQELIPQVSLTERTISVEPAANHVFVGIRRAGKSYLLYQYIHQLVQEGHSMEEILFVNFEDERISDIQKDELHLILEAYRELYALQPIIFLDEIQNVEGWEHFARRLADEKYRVFVTGSNAHMLSREIASTLGGRYLLREVYPFSFGEYLTFKGITLKDHWELSPVKSDVIRLMKDYFYTGGLAESFPLLDKRTWHQSLYDKILLSDIVMRKRIRNERSLRLMVRKLAESVMQPTSVKRIQNILQGDGTKITRETIADYLDYMHEAYLSFSLSNYTDSLAERATIQKHYFFDNGILNLFITEPDTKLLENLVAIHLYRIYGDKLLYFNRNVEVDFYVPDANELIQVSYSIRDANTRKREVDALKKTASFLNTSSLKIVTYEEEDTIEEDGFHIEVIPIYKFLLNNNQSMK